MDGDEVGGGFAAFGEGLGDGATILIEDGQSQIKAEGPFVLALIEAVSWAEMEVGPLLGDF